MHTIFQARKRDGEETPTTEVFAVSNVEKKVSRGKKFYRGVSRVRDHHLGQQNTRNCSCEQDTLLI